ncbi:MAG: SdrD B-like domain-containing protein [Clostridia bacterium]
MIFTARKKLQPFQRGIGISVILCLVLLLFGNALAQEGCEVSGVVNANGSPAANVTLTLQSASGLLTEQTTGADGVFAFQNVKNGNATLTISPPAGLAVMNVDDAIVHAIGPYQMALTLDAGKQAPHVVELAKAASMTGSAPELGAGKTITAVSVYANASTQTKEDGSFRFDGMAVGDYSIYVPILEGKTPAKDSPWRLTKQGDMLWLTVSVPTGAEHKLPELVFATPTSIEGCAYVDADGDFKQTQGEQLMTGVPVTLLRASGNDAWETVGNTQTDEYGKYAFGELTEGTYRISCQTTVSEYLVSAVGANAQALEDGSAICSQPLTLTNGMQSKGEADIGLQVPSTLQFSAYVDKNGDGVRTDKEMPLGGVKVEVLSGETAIASGETDTSGLLTLNGVRSGNHSLRVTMPSGYGVVIPAQPTAGQNGMTKAAGNVGTSETLAFAGGQTVAASAGARFVGSLGGMAFEDMNNNGVLDAGEPGVAGVQIHLVGNKTGAVYDLTTDETGNFCFDGLADDNYTISAVLPEGMLFARYSRTGGDLRSIFSGSTQFREYPVRNAARVENKNIGVIEKGVVEGLAFIDANYNGMLDEGEVGFEGVTLEVTKLSNTEIMGRTVSAKDGTYRFEGLRGGDYRLRAILPEGGNIFTKVPATLTSNANLFAQRGTRRENSIEPVSIVSGGSAKTLVGVAVGATLSGTVYQDADYNGSLNGKEKKLSGIKVQLVDAAGAVVATDNTAGDGKYKLEGIMPGQYTVCFQRKPAFGFTRLRPDEKGGSHVTMLQGELGVTAPIEIAMGQQITDINAGMLPASTVAGNLFLDTNDDGLRSEGEQGMVGASVRLLSEDGEIDLTKSVEVDGKYFFDGVMPGKYTLTYLLPEHAELSRVAEGGNTLENQGRETSTAPFSVTMGEAFQCPLVGAVVLGDFTGFLFHDINGNGVADEGEERMAGMEITLTPDRASAKTTSAVSQATGEFALNGLRPANYTLTMKLPSGYIFSHDLVADGMSLDAAQEFTTDCSWRILTNRTEKAIGAVKPASVSGVLWLDENKDGTQGNGEMLLSGVTLELVEETSARTVAHATSNEKGFTFENVRPGNYTVRFALPNQTEPAADNRSTFAPDGGYMADKGIAVAEGQSMTDLATGLVSRTSVGGKVWLDENGKTTPVAGVTVMLFAGKQTTPLQNTLTAEDGSYRFDGLWPEDYYLQASLPNGLIFVKPDDPNYDKGASVITAVGDATGTSELFYLQMAQHMLAQNIIYIKPAKVGDLVWLDENKNGLIDQDEPLIPGVQISLMQNGKAAYQTTSNAFGYYLFDDVYPGEYVLKATAYPELDITKQVPQLRMISSCLVSGDGTEAQTDAFSVVSGSKNTDADLGYLLKDGQQMPSAIVPPTLRDWTKKTE